MIFTALLFFRAFLQLIFYEEEMPIWLFAIESTEN